MSSNDAFAALRIPYVRSFALGQVAAVIGAQMISVAVGWELYERTHNPWSLGLVGLIELAPMLVLTVPAGNAADRYPRRHVAMFAHVLLCLAGLGLAFASWKRVPTTGIYALLLLIGSARAFASPSVGNLLPQLIPPEGLANTNAWISSGYELASISGPALGGLVIAMTGGTSWAYLIAALGQLVFITLLFRLPVRPPPPRGPRHDAKEVFAGFTFIRNSPVFLAAISLDLFAVLFGGAVALLPVFAKDILQVGPQGLGWLRASMPLGALAMALVMTRLPPWKNPGRVLLLAVSGFGLSTIGFGLSRSLLLSMACLFLCGACDSISVVIRRTLEQVITPDRLRGRVSAFNHVFVGFSNELGAFESGATAALFGPIASVLGGGIGTLLVVLAVIRVWPALVKVGPLHTLRPQDPEQVQGTDAAITAH